MTGLSKKIKVLIVDDSAVIRKILQQQLNQQYGIEVVGTAPNTYIALNKVASLKPDVLTLDIEMPRMDGITFLKELMKKNPMPVIVLSSVTPKGSKNAIESLEAGAMEVICKPGAADNIADIGKLLGEKIRMASKVCINKSIMRQGPCSLPPGRLCMTNKANKIITIGASTGGVQALTRILTAFPENAPPTLVVQHMPAQFTASFAMRLDHECSVRVKEAQNGDSVIPGQVLLAPGGFHMLLQCSGPKYYVTIKNGPLVCRQKPSIEVMFNSVAKFAGPNAVGVILTGMGSDGAEGLLNMRRNGSRTIAQDEDSCAVFGMPKEAIARGAAEVITPLSDIAEKIINFSQT